MLQQHCQLVENDLCFSSAVYYSYCTLFLKNVSFGSIYYLPVRYSKSKNTGLRLPTTNKKLTICSNKSDMNRFKSSGSEFCFCCWSWSPSSFLSLGKPVMSFNDWWSLVLFSLLLLLLSIKLLNATSLSNDVSKVADDGLLDDDIFRLMQSLLSFRLSELVIVQSWRDLIDNDSFRLLFIKTRDASCYSRKSSEGLLLAYFWPSNFGCINIPSCTLKISWIWHGSFRIALKYAYRTQIRCDNFRNHIFKISYQSYFRLHYLPYVRHWFTL